MTRRYRTLCGIAASLTLVGAGAAQAQVQVQAQTAAPAATPALPIKVWPGQERPAPDLANPLDPLAPTQIQAKTLDTAIFAKTSVDHQFTSKGDVTGSMGFLCGLQPGHGDTGGAAAYGVDPHGRFVGAKVSFAF